MEQLDPDELEELELKVEQTKEKNKLLEEQYVTKLSLSINKLLYKQKYGVNYDKYPVFVVSPIKKKEITQDKLKELFAELCKDYVIVE